MDYRFNANVVLVGPDIKASKLEDGLMVTDPEYLKACEIESKLKTYIEAFPDFPVKYADVEISWEDMEGT